MKTIGGHTFDETLLTDGVIIDVGCRGFEFANHFKYLAPNKYVYCIDPDNSVFNNIIEKDNQVYMNVAISDKEGKDNPFSKKVYQYSKDGTLIKEWASQADVKRDLGYSQGCISACCTGRQKTYKGFIWQS